MNYVSFSSLYVNMLPISGLFSLNKSTIELAKPLMPQLGTIPVAALAELELAQQNLGLGMNKAQKSELSDDVKLMDKERDGFLDEIFRVPGSYLRSNDAAKKSAATTLHIFLVPYKGVQAQPINFETGTIVDLVQKYRARTELIMAASVLGIDGLFNQLEAKNDALNAIYQDRTAEYSEREIAASAMKPAAVSAYIQFCTSIEQAENFSPSATIAALFNKMDEHRKHYHALEEARKTPPVETPAAN
jgi:hypothetical protein